ncbi:MAG TPA: MlaD family protein [Thermoleophilaceae bacterium]|nr:MlaD family protein [Thermoleophilaceae bacterium]
MSELRAGVIAAVVVAVLSWFGFTKANPFSDPFELRAAFRTANGLKPNSPVRIAGVEVGEVKQVEPVAGRGARVTMALQDRALPIHRDAKLKVRPRIFLEGNFYVDVQPGSPSAPAVENGDLIPATQTAAPVQLGDVLAELQRDAREDLQVFLAEYAKGLEGEGARGFNQAIRYWEGAYRSSALANDAMLGERPTRDLRRVLRGQRRTFAALARDERALKDLVTKFNVTAGALAREDEALRASVPALRDTLRAAQPALGSLNGALPSVRAFAVDALPGVRSSDETLRASLPFIRQARLLVRPAELRGLAAELRRHIPDLVTLNATSVPLLGQSRALSACTNEVLVPFVRTPVPDVAGEPDNSGQAVRFQIQRTFPGLSGESRMFDGNYQFFRGSGMPNPTRVQPAPPASGNQPPPRRPDVPCETQEPPDLHAPDAAVAQLGGPPQTQTSFDTDALVRAAELMRTLSRERRSGR